MDFFSFLIRSFVKGDFFFLLKAGGGDKKERKQFINLSLGKKT